MATANGLPCGQVAARGSASSSRLRLSTSGPFSGRFAFYGRPAGKGGKNFLPPLHKRQIAIPFHTPGQDIADQCPRLSVRQKGWNRLDNDGIPPKASTSIPASSRIGMDSIRKARSRGEG